MKNLFIIVLLIVFHINNKCLSEFVKLDDKVFIKDTDLFIKSKPQNWMALKPIATKIETNFMSKLKDYLNPLFWIRKFFETIPELGFLILGIYDYDCRYLTVCQTSNFLINTAPDFVLRIVRRYSTGLLSRIIGETPYIEAWSIGLIKSIDCRIFYNCTKSPFETFEE